MNQPAIYHSEYESNSSNKYLNTDAIHHENHNDNDDTVPGYNVNFSNFAQQNIPTDNSVVTFKIQKKQQTKQNVAQNDSQLVETSSAGIEYNNSRFSALGDEHTQQNQSGLSCELYTKPFFDKIKQSSEKVVQKCNFLLKNEEKLTKKLFNIAFDVKDKFANMSKDIKKIVNKSKFMAFTNWIPQLIESIFENLEEHANRILEEKKFDIKLNKLFNTLEMGIAPKTASTSKKLEMVLQEILDIKASQVIQKKNYTLSLESLNKTYGELLDNKNTKKLEKQIDEIKGNVEAKNTVLLSQIQNMENLIAKIDYERRAYRDRNEFLEEENEKVSSDLVMYKKISVELGKSADKTEILKDQYYNIAMMQMAECESLRLRNLNKHARFVKLRQEYDDLKHELSLLFKEKQIINAANRQEDFKKENKLLIKTRMMMPGGSADANTVVLQYKIKKNIMTKENNQNMFSKNLRVMKPSFYHLISEK